MLRDAVLWRKSSAGTDSEAGSRFVESMLSVVATCRQQERNVLEFLAACCRAQLGGIHPPSLLPREGLALKAGWILPISSDFLGRYKLATTDSARILRLVPLGRKF